MAVPIRPEPSEQAYLDDDGLLLLEFRETDPTVVEVLGRGDDVEGGAHHLLQVGARAVQAARVSLDTSMVERSFDALQRDFTHTVEDATKRVGDAAAALLDREDGALVGTLDGWRTEVERLLGDTFDPTSKRSVIAKLEHVLKEVAETQHDRVKRLLDLSDPDNPITRGHERLLDAVSGQRREMLDAFQSLAEKVAADSREAEIRELTTAKGFAYEDIVHEQLCRLLAPFGDFAEQVGTTTGLAGTKAGDEVVTLNPDDTGGHSAAYVLEIKDRKFGARAILDELDRSMANRGCAAAIAVFSSLDYAPSAVPFHYQGNRGIVVFDKHDPNPAALQLACMWARWMVRRSLANRSDTLDVEHVETLLDDARRELERVSQIRSAHTKSRNGLEEATKHLDALNDGLIDALAALAAALDTTS